MSVRLKRKAKGERPIFFDDPNVDKVIAMVMGLAGEVAVLHDRLDTVERLLEQCGPVKRAAIDAYVPSPEVATERAAWRETFLGEVLRIVEIELEAATSGDQGTYPAAIAAVEHDEKPRAAPRAKSKSSGKLAKKKPIRKSARKR
jgi:hypothetical protein